MDQATRPGVDLLVTVPSPNWPAALDPQVHGVAASTAAVPSTTVMEMKPRIISLHIFRSLLFIIFPPAVLD
jgi:hypothetical protein